MNDIAKRETPSTAVVDRRPWLKSYPPGIPKEIDADRFRSLPDLLDQTVARFTKKPAYHNLGHTLSYTALDRLSRNYAAFLQGLPGMG
jgi:long-chain acyl-CoA synthetase